MKKGSTKEMYLMLTVLDYCIACTFLVLMVLLKLLTLPYGLIKSVMSVSIVATDTSIEVTMINTIREWVVNHQNDLIDATETFGEEESYFIKIIPKLNNAATLHLEIGFPKYIRVSIDNFGIEFDANEVDDGVKLIQNILMSYENGKYYIKRWVYEDEIIDQCLVIEHDQDSQYISKTDGFKTLRKFFAKVKFKKFLPIAAA